MEGFSESTVLEEYPMAAKILIADDDVQTLKMVGLVLDRKGYDVVTSQSGEKALEKIQAEAPDLVILDIMMPGMDGYEVTRRLRANPETAALPIILFTGKAQLDDKVAGFEAGADDFVSKPVHPDEMVSRVRALLARSSRGQERAEAPPSNLIGFLGSKGGIGTTTLAVNAAVSLAQGRAKDQQVVLAELQDGITTAAFQLGFQREGGIARLLTQPLDAIDADSVQGQLDRHETGLLALTGQSDPPGVAEPISLDHAQAIIQHLGALADYVLLDLGVGLDEVNASILPRCRRIAVTIEPNGMCMALAQPLLQEMNQSLNVARHRIGLVSISRSRSTMSLAKEEIEEMLSHSLLGIVPPAPELAFQAIDARRPIVMSDRDSFVARQYRAVAESLIEDR